MPTSLSSLPDELLYLICEYLATTSRCKEPGRVGLTSLIWMNRRLRAIATPVLYAELFRECEHHNFNKEIVWDESDLFCAACKGTFGLRLRVQPLARTVSENSQLADQVRVLACNLEQKEESLSKALTFPSPKNERNPPTYGERQTIPVEDRTKIIGRLATLNIRDHDKLVRSLQMGSDNAFLFVILLYCKRIERFTLDTGYIPVSHVAKTNWDCFPLVSAIRDHATIAISEVNALEPILQNLKELTLDGVTDYLGAAPQILAIPSLKRFSCLREISKISEHRGGPPNPLPDGYIPYDGITDWNAHRFIGFKTRLNATSAITQFRLHCRSAPLWKVHRCLSMLRHPESITIELNRVEDMPTESRPESVVSLATIGHVLNNIGTSKLKKLDFRIKRYDNRADTLSELGRLKSLQMLSISLDMLINPFLQAEADKATTEHDKRFISGQLRESLPPNLVWLDVVGVTDQWEGFFNMIAHGFPNLRFLTMEIDYERSGKPNEHSLWLRDLDNEDMVRRHWRPQDHQSLDVPHKWKTRMEAEVLKLQIEALGTTRLKTTTERFYFPLARGGIYYET